MKRFQDPRLAEMKKSLVLFGFNFLSTQMGRTEDTLACCLFRLNAFGQAGVRTTAADQHSK
jgi:hypothetical protein